MRYMTAAINVEMSAKLWSMRVIASREPVEREEKGPGHSLEALHGWVMVG